MFVGHVTQVPSNEVSAPGARSVSRQALIGPPEGWDGWVMRQFTIRAQGFTPRHRHDWPHINYVLQGAGILYLEGQEHTLSAGSIAYVPANAEHQFMQKGGEDLIFICIVPQEGDR